MYGPTFKDIVLCINGEGGGQIAIATLVQTRMVLDLYTGLWLWNAKVS